MMEVGRQRIPESRSRHREAAAGTSQTGARYSQAHSGAGRAQCPAWRVQIDHGVHVDRCIIGVQGLIGEAHQLVTHSLVARSQCSVSSAGVTWSRRRRPITRRAAYSSEPAAVPGVQRQTGPPTGSYNSPPWTSPRTARAWRGCPYPGSV